MEQSIIVRAQGEAKSAELIGEAVRTNKGFLQLRRLEAARDIATILATSGNRVMLDAQSLLLNGESLICAPSEVVLMSCTQSPLMTKIARKSSGLTLYGIYDLKKTPFSNFDG